MRVLAVVLAVLLCGPSVVDAADDCDAPLTVASKRGVLNASVEKPTAGVTAGACVRVLGQPITDDRTLMPSVTEVAARFHMDFGVNVTTLTVVVDGLGFANATFLANRTPVLRTWEYAMDFAEVPDGPSASGELNVTVLLPGGASVTKFYRTFD